MNSGFLLAVLLMVAPAIAAATFFKRIEYSTIVAATVDVVIASLLYYIRPPVGTFFVDNVSWVFIIMICSVFLLSSIYSLRYLSGKTRGFGLRIYYLLLNLFVISMLFSALINNFGLMWVGIEATTISSALLIMTEKTEGSVEATWRYIILVSAGVTFAFFSVILIYYSFGTLNVSAILSMHSRNTFFARIAVAIALIGFGTKVGIFPVHTWLPDAHSEAPSPVSAMFSGVLLPVALYVLFRIYEIDPDPELFIWLGTLSIIAASILLGYQSRYKRLFAYSTMENMSLALIGFATLNPLGIIGSLYLLISHSFSKAGAFYSSGNFLKSTDTKNVEEISGTWKNMPYSSASMLMSSLGVSGTPPFGTFFGEILILYSLAVGNYIPQLILIVIFLVTAFIGINYNVSRMIMGEPANFKEPGRLMPAVSIISASIPLLIGAYFLVVFNALV